MMMIILIFLLSLFWIPSAFAVTRYVAETGASVSCATMQNINTPSNSLSTAIGCSTAIGDVVQIRGGTYGAVVISNLTNSITIESYPGETALIQASSDLIVFSSDQARTGWMIRNLELSCNSAAGKTGLIFNAGLNNSFIEKNNIHHCTGAILGNGNSLTIQENKMHTLGVGGNPNFDHGIYAFLNNSFVIRNVIDGQTAGSCYQVAGGDNTLVANNVFANCNVGMYVYYHDAVQRVYTTNYKFLNNIFINNGLGGSPGAAMIWDFSSSASGNIVNNNLFFNNPQGNITGATGQFTEANNQYNVDPLVVNSTTHDWTLQSGSPAINAGTTSGLSLAFNGASLDIGRYETATVSSCVTVDSSNVDCQLQSAYAPFTQAISTQEFILKRNTVILNSGSGTIGNATVRINVAPGSLSGTDTITVSHVSTAGGVADTAGQLLMSWPDFAVNNTLGGSGPVFTTKHFRCRAWNHNLTSNTPQDWRGLEDTACSVQNQNGKIAVAWAIVCEGGNCPSSGFDTEFQVNGGPGWTDTTNSIATNALGYDNTQVGGATHGAAITSSLLTNPYPTFVNGGVVAQDSSYPIVDLSQNSTTNYLASFAVKNGLTAGSTQICVRPKHDSGTVIGHDVTACFNIVNPGAQMP